MAEDQICPICKNPRRESGGGSLTQWIVLCNCDAAKLQEVEELVVQLCRSCGKRIGEGRPGSFTQYIFRSDVCQCSTPQPYEQSMERTSTLDPVEYLLPDYDDDQEELPFAPGEFPSERYKPLDRLGEGGGGNVYLARDRLLQKLVAVKLLHSLSEKDMVSFQEEAKKTSKLSHPNIVKILDFGVTDDSVPYMVLEYVAGATLEEVLQRRTRLDLKTCLHVFDHVCQGLVFAHEHGILHGDIKPGNILLVVDENKDMPGVKIIDFGIARTAGQPECEGTMAGAPLYMSPDPGRGLEYDARSEVYSLACVLYKSLTGQAPFTGSTAVETLRMHAEQSPRNPGELAADLPPLIGENLLRGLAKTPDDRFQSVGEFRSRLLELEPSEQPDTPENAPVVEQSGTDAGAGSLPAAVVATVLLTVLTASLLFLSPSRDSSTGHDELPRQPEDRTYNEARGLFGSMKEEEIDKELGWTGGRWKFNYSPQHRIVMVNGHDVTDEDIKEILDRDFQGLKMTMESKFTGEGLRYLIGKRKLVRFWTMSTQFNDIGACNLAEFPDLKMIKIQSCSKLTKRGFDCIASLPNLEYLELRSVFNFPREGMRGFRKSLSLKRINFRFAGPLYLEDIKDIAAIKRIRSLALNGVTEVDDTYIPELMRMKRLKILEIGGTRVTDRGLAMLAKMTKLRKLGITLDLSERDGSELISQSGLRRFKRENPRCKVKIIQGLTGMQLF